MSRTVEDHRKSGFRFRLIDMVFVVTIGTLVLSLLPMLNIGRGPSRRTSCGNNLRQLGLAMLNYESAHGHFPAAIGDPMFAKAQTVGNDIRLNGLIPLLPYLEEGAIYDEICNASLLNDVAYPAFGPKLSGAAYPPWQQNFSLLKCPSSQRVSTGIGQTNYAFCIGDRAVGIHQPGPMRGAFGFGAALKLADFVDGTSQTIAMSEIGNSNGQRRLIGNVAIHQPVHFLSMPNATSSLEIQYANRYYADRVTLGAMGRGGRWYDGAANYSLFNTILPPNAPSVAIGGAEAVDGFFSAGSEHVGLVNTLFIDGSTSCISDKIDCGNPSAVPPTLEQMESRMPSSFGVWGALGTINGSESPAEGDY